MPGLTRQGLCANISKQESLHERKKRMLLAVDIGNSSIDLGVFDENGTLLMKSKMSAVKTKCTDEYAVILSGICLLYTSPSPRDA